MENLQPLQIDEPEGGRFELALEQFEKGDILMFRGAGFGRSESELEIRAPIQWSPEYVTRARVDEVIASAEEKLQALKSASRKFRKLVERMPVRIVVLYDYGMGGIEMAESAQGQFSWLNGYPIQNDAV